VQETCLLQGVWGCPPTSFKSPKVWGITGGWIINLPTTIIHQFDTFTARDIIALMKSLKYSTITLISLSLTLLSACTTIPTPNEPGPYQIGDYSIIYNVSDFGTYEATIRYPAKAAGELTTADKSHVPYPGIVVSSGRGGGEWSVSWISEHLTSHGYVTLAFTPPDMFSNSTTQWAYGFIGGIEQLKMLNNESTSPIYGLIDTDKFGVIGLSMGGAGCIEAAGATDSEVDAAVPLAPAGYNASYITATMIAAYNIAVPIQLQVGSADSFVPPDRVLPFYTNLIPDSTIKEYIVIDGGNHIGFLTWNFAEIATQLEIESNISIGFEEQRRISSYYFTAWFQYYLKGLEGYYNYIFGDDAIQLNVSTLEYNIP
jgi:dienelactone hydrolase